MSSASRVRGEHFCPCKYRHVAVSVQHAGDCPALPLPLPTWCAVGVGRCFVLLHKASLGRCSPLLHQAQEVRGICWEPEG